MDFLQKAPKETCKNTFGEGCMMQRTVYVLANWKLHMTGEEAAAFLTKLREKIPAKPSMQVGIAPPYTAIPAAVRAARSTPVAIGAQAVSAYDRGGYTGEVAAAMVAAEGASFALVGHSERRRLFGETGEVVCAKIKQALAATLKVVLCIGETEEEREAGKTQSILEEQLRSALEEVNVDLFSRVVIAYEPVWAIGTGKAATVEIAAKAHDLCRQFLAKKWGETVAAAMPILYGGSVKPENVQAFLRCEGIDGALIGGASLSVDTFCKVLALTEELFS